MSFVDDQSAEIEERLEVARQRSIYGRSFSCSYLIAGEIKRLRRLIPWAKRKRDPGVSQLVREMKESVAERLVTAAITDSGKLREVADALDAEERADPRQANIITAYEECIQSMVYPPTLAALRKTFVDMFGQRCWTSDFSVRKTLTALDLPLHKDRRGRPRGARSLIRN